MFPVVPEFRNNKGNVIKGCKILHNLIQIIHEMIFKPVYFYIKFKIKYHENTNSNFFANGLGNS